MEHSRFSAGQVTKIDQIGEKSDIGEALDLTLRLGLPDSSKEKSIAVKVDRDQHHHVAPVDLQPELALTLGLPGYYGIAAVKVDQSQPAEHYSDGVGKNQEKEPSPDKCHQLPTWGGDLNFEPSQPSTEHDANHVPKSIFGLSGFVESSSSATANDKPSPAPPRSASKVLAPAPSIRKTGKVCEKRCFNHLCNTSVTPMWRRGPCGPKTLCNACGLKYRKQEGMNARETNSP